MTKTKKKNRKDSKGKVLRTGESERSNGTYMYRYVPKIRGRSVNSPEKKDNRITIYAKTLPELRQKELQITQDIIEEIDTVNGNKTVASMTKLYIDLKKNLHFTTRESYLSVYRCHIKDSWFGEMYIKDVTKTDVILFYNEITEDLTNSFLENVHRIIHGCFDLALENHWIRFNPTQNVMRLYPANVPERQPYTKEEENLLLNFVKNDGTYYIYYPLIICFLETMLRASEMFGLTWSNIDFINNTITVDHQVLYTRYEGKYQFIASKVKTKAGNRVIPLTQRAKKAFLYQRKQQISLNRQPTIQVGSYSDFVFTTRSGRPYTVPNVDKYFSRLIKAYNRKEAALAKKEGRDPISLPHLTCHVLRHTGCSNFCKLFYKERLDIKILQKWMGHASIEITMEIYNHATEADQEDALKAIEQARQKLCL